MANQLQLQTDPVSIGFRALGLQRSLLGVLSADGVWAHAAEQLEILGDKFPVNGPAVQDVKNALQRYGNPKVDQFWRLAGWRKGDTAAAMVQTAGGQAAALLALCLSNLLKDSHPGEIVYRVSERLLSRGENKATVEQICGVIKVLADKAATLRYGIWLCEKMKMVADACQDETGKWPEDIRDTVNADTAVDLLTAVSDSLREEDTVVRITGTQGMGYIVAMTLYLFPEDTVFMVNGKVRGEPIRRKIILNIRDTGAFRSTIERHRTMGAPACLTLPIKVDRKSQFAQPCRFPWEEWVKKRLELRYWSAGQRLANSNILEPCCGLLLALGCSVEKEYMSGTSLLASVSLGRMRQVCRKIFGTEPPPLKDCNAAFKDLQRAFLSSHDLTCICASKSPRIENGWPRPTTNRSHDDCILHQLWNGVGQALNDGFACFFIEADDGVTVVEGKKRFATDSITDVLKDQDKRRNLSSHIIWEMVFGLLGASTTDAVGVSNGGCTLYPTVLQTLQVPSEWQLGFRLVDGRFVYEDQYFDKLTSLGENRKARIRQNALSNLGDILPWSNKPQYKVCPTLQKRVGFLELRMNIQVKYMEEGRTSPTEIETVLDMKKCCIGFFELVRTGRCEHYPNIETMLDRKYRPRAVSTRLDSPRAENSTKNPKVAIAATNGDSTIQLFFCEEGWRAILMQDSCLTCAFEQALQQGFDVIIVS